MFHLKGQLGHKLVEYPTKSLDVCAFWGSHRCRCQMACLCLAFRTFAIFKTEPQLSDWRETAGQWLGKSFLHLEMQAGWTIGWPLRSTGSHTCKHKYTNTQIHKYTSTNNTLQYHKCIHTNRIYRWSGPFCSTESRTWSLWGFLQSCVTRDPGRGKGKCQNSPNVL